MAGTRASAISLSVTTASNQEGEVRALAQATALLLRIDARRRARLAATEPTSPLSTTVQDSNPAAAEMAA